MQLLVEMYEPSDGPDVIRLSSPAPLCSAVEPGVDVGSNQYYRDLERDLVPLARAPIDHLCRGLDNISVSVDKDGTGSLVGLTAYGPAAASVYMRMCSRIDSAYSLELPLRVALERNLGEPVEVDLQVNAEV